MSGQPQDGRHGAHVHELLEFGSMQEIIAGLDQFPRTVLQKGDSILKLALV